MLTTSGDPFVEAQFENYESSTENLLLRFRDLPVAKFLLAHKIQDIFVRKD